MNPKAKNFKKKEPTKKHFKCYFYSKEEHFQKDYPKHKAWFEKKGMYKTYVCTFESNLNDVPHNS